MAEVKYPAYRSYMAARQDANNAMMALLAGSRLAAHTLQLTEGSAGLLPAIFPSVSHIERFSLRTEEARQLLLDADEHLGAVAVPYALAVHESYVMGSIELLEQASVTIQKVGKNKQVRAWNMHEVFFLSASALASSTSLEQFHLLRKMRNSQIHLGGAVSEELREAVSGLSGSGTAAWQRMTGRAASGIIASGSLRFSAGDIFAAFAVTKALGRQVNTALQSALSREIWCEIAAVDFAAATDKPRNSDTWMRSLYGYARVYYGPLALRGPMLEAASVTKGLWDRPVGVVSARKRDK